MIRLRKSRILFAVAAAFMAAAIALICIPVFAHAQESEKSGLAYDIPLVEEFESNDKISEECTNVILRLDKELNVINKAGDVIMPLSEVDIGDRIPVYYARTVVEADAVSEYITSHGIVRAIVGSANPATVLRMRSRAKNVRGLIDMRSAYEEDIADKEYLTEVREKLNENNATIVLFPATAEYDGIRFLRRLSVSVWMYAETNEEIASAVSCGADAVVGNAAKANAVISSLGKDILPPPFIIAHRGLSGIKRPNGSDYHENTVEAAWAAYTEGGADTIEIDIYLSKDNELVVMHNPTLDGTTNGTGAIQNMTLAEIRQNRVVGANASLAGHIEDQIPILDDYFEKFKGEDCNIFIEIKGDRIEIVDYLKAKIDEYDFSTQCSVICFNYNCDFLAAVREKMPGMSVGRLLDYNKGEKVDDILKMTASQNATFNPGHGNLTAEQVALFKRCGLSVWPWTYRNQEIFTKDYYIGAAGLTLDYCGWLNEYAKIFTPEELTLTVQPDTKFAIGATVKTFGGEEFETQYTFKKISGDIELQLSSNGYFTASGEGSGYIVLCYDNYSPAFTAVSKPIYIESKVKPAEENPPANTDTDKEGGGKKSGCGSVVAAGSALIAAVFITVAAAVVWCRKKQSNRNNKNNVLR